MFNPNDLTPTQLDDMVYGNAKAKSKLKDIVSGNLPIPAFGKCGILLCGAVGTGKATLARILPNMMDQARGGQDSGYEFHQCAMGGDGASTVQKVCSKSELISLDVSGLHYFVLDEIDNWTTRTQQTLKAAMNYQHTAFIMTTNRIEKIDAGIKNRSYRIQMDAAQPSDWLPFASLIRQKSKLPRHKIAQSIAFKAESLDSVFFVVYVCPLKGHHR
jgi:replication-associated recombination protein RarA